MLQWLKAANGLNPKFRPIPGFQPVYEADSEKMMTVLQHIQTADYFDVLYTTKDIEIYMVAKLLKENAIRFHDIRFIASLIGEEKWLIIAGVIPVNDDRQLKPQVRIAKKKLVKAINKKWHIDIRKKEVYA